MEVGVCAALGEKDIGKTLIRTARVDVTRSGWRLIQVPRPDQMRAFGSRVGYRNCSDARERSLQVDIPLLEVSAPKIRSQRAQGRGRREPRIGWEGVL